jgi:hypothetical protein
MNELVLSLVTAAFAWWCAMDDAEAIAERRKIRHGLQWCMRAAWVLLWCGLFDAWLLALPLAFLFSGVFRLCLNRLRSLDVRYLSPSSWYDWTFIWIGSLPGRGFYVSALWDNKARKTIEAQWGTIGYHAGWEPYVRWAHRGGTIAYVFEALAYGVGLWYV